MAAATLFAQPFAHIVDDAGAIAVGAKIYVYQAGGSTPAVVYHDADLSTPWVQPIVTNAAGNSTDPIFVATSPSLKVNVTDANDVQLDGWPMDDWSPYALA